MYKILSGHGILFIGDEVQTGRGRTGEHFWGDQAQGVVPNILTFAKGAGNRLALAGVVARAEIMDTIDVNSFSTFGGNPLVAVGGRATPGVVLGEDLSSSTVAGRAARSWEWVGSVATSCESRPCST